MSTSHSAGERHPAQWLALAIGVVYLLIAVAGFAATGFEGFAEPDGELLLGVFEVNPLHNIVHLLIGALGVVLWTTVGRTVLYGWILAVGYGLTFLYGLAFAETDEPANFLALNQPDNWLHLLSALAGVAIIAWTWNLTRGRPAAPRPGTRQAVDEPTRRRPR